VVPVHGTNQETVFIVSADGRMRTSTVALDVRYVLGWSADSRYFAFIDRLPSQNNDFLVDVVYWSADTQDFANLPSGMPPITSEQLFPSEFKDSFIASSDDFDIWSSAWSPNGHQFAYLSTEPDANETPKTAVIIYTPGENTSLRFD